jgi:hypothetical protein
MGGNSSMMPQPSRQVSINDLLLVLGQQTVELAFARTRIAELEQQLARPSADGVEEAEDVPTIA